MKKTLVLFYSFTGNNEKLAKRIADYLSADYQAINEINKRNFFTIVLDVVFNRIPHIHKPVKEINQYEHVIFIAPIWLGKIASPLRSVFKLYRENIRSYSFISLSGGADGVNVGIEHELVSRLGKKPVKVDNPLIIDLLPTEPRPTRQQLEDYRLSDVDASKVLGRLEAQLNQIS